MKKIIALTLAVIICLGLCSCSLFQKIDAIYLYTKAAETLANAQSYEMICDMTMGMSFLGINMDMTFDIDMKVAGENAQIAMKILEQDITVTMIDDIMYMDAIGQSVKYTVPEEEEETVTDDFVAAELPEIGREILEATEVIENEDGTKALELTLSSEQAESLMGLAGDMYANMKFDNIVLTLRFDEKNVISGMAMTGQYTASEEGIELGGEIVADYTFKNFGGEVEITIPNPVENYTDGGVYDENVIS